MAATASPATAITPERQAQSAALEHDDLARLLAGQQRAAADLAGGDAGAGASASPGVASSRMTRGLVGGARPGQRHGPGGLARCDLAPSRRAAAAPTISGRARTRAALPSTVVGRQRDRAVWCRQDRRRRSRGGSCAPGASKRLRRRRSAADSCARARALRRRAHAGVIVAPVPSSDFAVALTLA